MLCTAICMVVACSMHEQQIRTGSHGKLGNDAASINLPHNLHDQAVQDHISVHCDRAEGMHVLTKHSLNKLWMTQSYGRQFALASF